MKYFKLILFILLLKIAFQQSSNDDDLIKVDGKPTFLDGPNVAWDNYGNDYGNGGYNNQYWDNTFKQISQDGGNSARIFLFGDMSKNPEFDSQGNTEKLEPGTVQDVNQMLKTADKYHINVVLSVADFLIDKNNHQNIISDDQKQKEYIDNALIPLVKGTSQNKNLVAYEVMNEPEWLVENNKVSKEQLQKFVANSAVAIHDNSKKPVTVGSASLKWNSDSIKYADGNWYSDKALQSQVNNPKAKLDFYEVHYYDWMKKNDYSYSPYDYKKSDLKLDKPVLIGETGNTGYNSYDQQFQKGKDNGYSGVMVWAYNSKGAADYSQFKDAMKNFADKNKDVVFPNDLSYKQQQNMFSQIKNDNKKLQFENHVEMEKNNNEQNTIKGSGNKIKISANKNASKDKQTKPSDKQIKTTQKNNQQEQKAGKSKHDSKIQKKNKQNIYQQHDQKIKTKNVEKHNTQQGSKQQHVNEKQHQKYYKWNDFSGSKNMFDNKKSKGSNDALKEYLKVKFHDDNSGKKDHVTENKNDQHDAKHFGEGHSSNGHHGGESHSGGGHGGNRGKKFLI